MQTYQNLTDYPQVILNVGIVPPNGTIETDQELNSQHLKLITNQQSVAPMPQSVQTAPELPTEGEQ